MIQIKWILSKSQQIVTDSITCKATENVHCLNTPEQTDECSATDIDIMGLLQGIHGKLYLLDVAMQEKQPEDASKGYSLLDEAGLNYNYR